MLIYWAEKKNAEEFVAVIKVNVIDVNAGNIKYMFIS
jgi:hypothetical protein